MYDSTAIFMAQKLKEFCGEHDDCSKCCFAYHPTLIGLYGERTAPYLECRLNEVPKDWTFPEEGRT